MRADALDFLLECIGFPPGYDLTGLARQIAQHGEPAAWRGPAGVHLSYRLCDGLEVRLDREEGQEHWTLWPYFDARRRLRVSVQSFLRLPDSPYDVLLHGIANPPVPDDPWSEASGADYPLACYLTDARRLPGTLRRGHVLAVSISGFALDVDYVGPNEGVRDRYVLDEPDGALLLPVHGKDRPGGTMQLSLLVRSVRRIENPLSRERVDVLEVDAPGRPLELFISRWQLSADGHEAPRPGWRIEGAFLFTGRVSGGLPSSPVHAFRG